MQHKIWHFIVAAGAYFLAGKKGLSLTAVPQFETKKR